MNEVAITPLYRLTAESHYREYFQDEFQTQRLGSQGRWLGPAAPLLRLKDPVGRRDFEDLLAGRFSTDSTSQMGEIRSVHAPLAWSLSFQAEPAATALWAVGPKAARVRIARGHIIAARTSLAYLEQTLAGRDTPPLTRNRPAGVMAVFNSGATENQMPCVRTTGFLFNFALRPDGTAVSFHDAQVGALEAKVTQIYGETFAAALGQYLGSYQRVFDEFRARPPLDLLTRMSNSSGEPLTKEPLAPARSQAELWSQWRERAEACHWGPRQAQIAIRLAKRELFVDRFSRAYFFGSRRVARQWLGLKAALKDASRSQPLNRQPSELQRQIKTSEQGHSISQSH